ncbi:MAG: carbohydrate binding domain-containing protein, partial [Candidatus Firestonebacteria bacterium]
MKNKKQIFRWALCIILLATQTYATNLIKNSSFEVGLEGYGVRGKVYLDNGEKEIKYIPPVLDTQEKYHGAVSLKIDNSNLNSRKIFCKELKLETNKTYTFSFWAKASNSPVKIHAGFVSIEDIHSNESSKFSPNFDWNTTRTFIILTDWKRYTISKTLKSGNNYFNIFLESNACSECVGNAAGIIWIDALQLEEGNATEYKPADCETGIESILPRRYTLSLTEKYPIKFNIRNNTSNEMKLKLKYKVIDEYFEKIIKTGEMSITAKANSTDKKIIEDIALNRRGKFILQSELIDKKIIEDIALNRRGKFIL